MLRTGVVDVAFDVKDSFFYYSSGIYNPRPTPPPDSSDCKYSSGSTVNHAMLAVGYGIENGLEFAIVRNSWGVRWGEQGYIRIALTTAYPGVCALYSHILRADAGF